MNKKIKVLFISHSSGMVGAERSLLLLLKYIDRNIFFPIVVLPRPGKLDNDIKKLKIKRYFIKSPWWVNSSKNKLILFLRFCYSIIKEIKSTIQLYQIVKKENIDVIYTNTIVIFSGAIIGYISRKPHIWHVREIITDNPDLKFLLPDRWLFSFISKYTEKIVVNSISTSEQFKNNNLKNKVKVIYNAVENEGLMPGNTFFSIDGVSAKDHLIAIVGTLQKRKAQDDAIKAIAIVEKTIPNVKLLIVGEGNKSYKSYLKNISTQLNLQNKVVFMGYRDDVSQILSYCKILLVPSWNEPFGRVAIEAMAVGVPIIGSDAGGLKEIIENGINGYLVQPKNPSMIAEKIIFLLKHKEKAREMGNMGQKIVRNKFNVSGYTQGIEKVIKEVSIKHSTKKYIKY